MDEWITLQSLTGIRVTIRKDDTKRLRQYDLRYWRIVE